MVERLVEHDKRQTQSAHEQHGSSAIKLSPAMQQRLRCPVCRAALDLVGSQLRCTNTECDGSFPIVHGVPVLINEAASVFSTQDFINLRPTYFKQDGPVVQTIRRFIPKISANIKGARNFQQFARLLLERADAPKVLIIGGGILGQGAEHLLDPRIELVESDVALGPRTAMIADAHDIPFEDETFDGVIAQAVLEHVVDPHRCVEEIHRVLKHGGYVYAETPFIQQVHGRRYDFTRFTHLGHRRLFRNFEEVDGGATCGPGMALAWTYQYFLLSFTTWKPARAALRAFARLTSFYLKYFDYYLIDKAGTLDAASGYYFIGRKAGTVLSDRELIMLYKGAG
ncbi:MAG TPA: methyltransferase domain-containing protein [Herpetosiphonaceae bacterium]